MLDAFALMMKILPHLFWRLSHMDWTASLSEYIGSVELRKFSKRTKVYLLKAFPPCKSYTNNISLVNGKWRDRDCQ